MVFSRCGFSPCRGRLIVEIWSRARSAAVAEPVCLGPSSPLAPSAGLLGRLPRRPPGGAAGPPRDSLERKRAAGGCAAWPERADAPDLCSRIHPRGGPGGAARLAVEAELLGEAVPLLRVLQPRLRAFPRAARLPPRPSQTVLASVRARAGAQVPRCAGARGPGAPLGQEVQGRVVTRNA